jgi:hypothetical protein
MRRVPDIAAAEIARLRADGIDPSDDDIVWLSSLGRRVHCPRGLTPEAADIRYGVRLSNGERLAGLTVAASDWLARWRDMWPEGEDIYPTAFALRSGVDFDELDTASKVVNSVADWRAGLNVSIDELVGAVERMLGVDSPSPEREEDDEPTDTESVIETLVAATGLPAEYWRDKTWAHVAGVNRGLTHWASMIGQYGGDGIDQRESKQALTELAMAIDEIRRRENG